MLVALTSTPALMGTQEAIRQGQQKERKEAHRARRCNMVVTCVKQNRWSDSIDHKKIVLRDGRLVIDTVSATDTETDDGYDDGEDNEKGPHLCTGYFLPYPDSEHEGLVTSISDDPPIMNWIYVDKDTLEVKYGVRVDAQPHITGPFDCTRQDKRLTLDGWEGFVAAQQADGSWALYFDRDDNGLKDKVQRGSRVLEVELWRVEKRRKRGEPAS